MGDQSSEVRQTLNSTWGRRAVWGVAVVFVVLLLVPFGSPAPDSLGVFNAACTGSVGKLVDDAAAELKQAGGKAPIGMWARVAYPTGARPASCHMDVSLDFQVKSSKLIDTRPLTGEGGDRFRAECDAVVGEIVTAAMDRLIALGGHDPEFKRSVSITHGPTVDNGTPGGDDWSHRTCSLQLGKKRQVVSAKADRAAFF